MTTDALDLVNTAVDAALIMAAWALVIIVIVGAYSRRRSRERGLVVTRMPDNVVRFRDPRDRPYDHARDGF